MNLLVIGGGGREHALVSALRRSSSVSRIWCAPGNGGIAQDAECVPADLSDVGALAGLAATLGADLTVAGPEQPLVLGVYDEFERRGLKLVGPSKECAQLEGSKTFAKRFLERHGIATAAGYGVYHSAEEASKALYNVKFPLALKADGLCAGKGVLVTDSRDAAESFITRAFEKKEFGEGGSRILMEEALAGEELSFIVLADGHAFLPLVAARDHKRAWDGDEGPNTGGMGAFSNDKIVSDDMRRQILDTIVGPTMRGLAKDGYIYRGFLYFGLILTQEGPKVLEFNCRLGDPETQAIVARMDFDLGAALAAVANGKLGSFEMKWKSGASVCVVIASGGYPGAYDTGKEITGLPEAAAVPGVAIYHAGTTRKENRFYTAGGRVLGVTATGDDLKQARDRAYQAAEKIKFSTMHYRTDIARSAGKSASLAGKAWKSPAS